MSCGDPEGVDNGFVRFSSTVIGSQAWYSCNEGFDLEGSESRTCQSSGEWEPEVPVCECKPWQYRAICIYMVGMVKDSTIQSSYIHNHVSILYQTAASGCERLENPENGRVWFASTEVGSFAKYFCNDGFRLEGFKFRKCLVSGWSGMAPTCERKTKLKKAQ